MKLIRHIFPPAIIVLFCILSISGQKSFKTGLQFLPKNISLKQDTSLVRKSLIMQEQDTNFTWQKYASFLKKISDTSKYIVLPLNEFRKTFNSNKIVIGLRHDVDIDLDIAYKFSKIESSLGFRSTYFILHTAPYYVTSETMANHNSAILPVLKKMQNENNFEIGWHNDLVTLQLIYNINPVTFLRDELYWLRTNGIKITGTAAHGSGYCKTYHYMNYYFFEECSYPIVSGRENNETVPVDGKVIPILKSTLAAHNLDYEAYFLNNNKAYSDATFSNGVRWNIGMLDLDKLKKGDRIIILLHPIHWHKASEVAKFESFSLPGQKSCVIDTVNHKIRVEMPAQTDRSALKADFRLSKGAFVKAEGKVQESNTTINNFNRPVTYVVYAENSQIKKEWVVEVFSTKKRADFMKFSFSDYKGESTIDTSANTIKAIIYDAVHKKSLRPSFILSENSHAWIGNQEQISDANIVDFTTPVTYNVISGDNQKIKKWKVTVLNSLDFFEKPSLTVYPNPSGGNLNLHFSKVTKSPVRIELYNSSGEKVYSDQTNLTGEFTLHRDLNILKGGIYFLKYTGESNSLKILINKKL